MFKLVNDILNWIKGTDNSSAPNIKLTGSNIPDAQPVPVKGIGSFYTKWPYDNVVLMPDVTDTLGAGLTSTPTSAQNIIDFKKFGIFADLKATELNTDLIFEVSPSGITNDWFALETKNFNNPTSRYQYFILANNADVCANYLRISQKNNGASPITLAYVRMIMKG